MGNQVQLRDKVRQLLQSGLIPACGPDSIRGGLGSGAPCAVCGEAIQAGEIELEIERTPCDAGDRLTVHLRCYAICEDERQNARDPGRPASGTLRESR